uniref:hypothetical protein n=1 Tax=Bacillus sp. WP8 TaxID=756828 RepID=UPI0037C1434E
EGVKTVKGAEGMKLLWRNEEDGDEEGEDEDHEGEEEDDEGEDEGDKEADGWLEGVYGEEMGKKIKERVV